MKDDEVLCTVKWVVDDVKVSFERCFGRYPTEDELADCLSKIDWGRVQDVMIETGWDVIDTAIADATNADDELE